MTGRAGVAGCVDRRGTRAPNPCSRKRECYSPSGIPCVGYQAVLGLENGAAMTGWARACRCVHLWCATTCARRRSKPRSASIPASTRSPSSRALMPASVRSVSPSSSRDPAGVGLPRGRDPDAARAHLRRPATGTVETDASADDPPPDDRVTGFGGGLRPGKVLRRHSSRRQSPRAPPGHAPPERDVTHPARSQSSSRWGRSSPPSASRPGGPGSNGEAGETDNWRRRCSSWARCSWSIIVSR